jgi:hypothetical protein
MMIITLYSKRNTSEFTQHAKVYFKYNVEAMKETETMIKSMVHDVPLRARKNILWMLKYVIEVQ